MRISAQLLYSYLSEHYPIVRLGQGFQSDGLPLPMFYSRGAEIKKGALYVVRTQDLPQNSNADCLFLCAGNRPAHIGAVWRGEVLYIDRREMDVFALFNFVIGFFDRTASWERAMEELLSRDAPVKELVRASLPLFGNCITITDYNLRILVNCAVEESGGRPAAVISEQFDRVPDEISMTFLNTHRQRSHFREPYTYKGQRLNPEGENYCINLHLGSAYLGTCTLWDGVRPMRESDYILFQQFASYIRRAISAQSRIAPDQLVTIKSILSDLLQSFPVSREELQWALDLQQKNMELQGVSLGCWHCLVIRSASKNKTLPEEYLCTSLENMLPYSTAIAYEGVMVCYCTVPQGADCEEAVCRRLTPYLGDMNFRAGISTPFQDIFKARDYYLQAKAILEMGCELSREQYLYRFADYILPYMLRRCPGAFEVDKILLPGLEALRTLEGSVDYWDTLRRYLDNECNASKTAQDLFLHRSSLLLRLEKIKALVPLDTPEQRLYLRMCIALLDMPETKKQKE